MQIMRFTETQIVAILHKGDAGASFRYPLEILSP